MTEAKASTGLTLTTLQDFWQEKLPTEEETKTPIVPVGILLYAQKRKMVMIGSHVDDRFRQALTCSYLATPEGFDSEQVLDGKSRVLDLSNYEQLRIEQVSFAEVHIATFRSIRSRPSVNIRIPTINPLNNKTETVNIDELEILRFFAGETEGGIAVFSGTNLAEDNALVLERNTNSGKCGIALFMYPDIDPVTASDTFDSVTGLYTFAKKLNEELISISFPLQTRALAIYNRALKEETFNFQGIDVREEIFRTQIIANARLAENLKEPRYMEFLQTHLPDLDTQIWARRFRTLLIKDNKNLQALADKSIDQMILGEQLAKLVLPQLPIPRKKDTEEDFLAELKTPEARNIWHTVGNDYKDDWRGRRSTFVRSIVNFIEDAKNPDEIEDSLASLRRMEESSGFRKSKAHYSLDGRKPESKIIWSPYSDYCTYEHSGKELIGYLRIRVLDRKKSWSSQKININARS